jgi:hypothetical protein
MSNIMKSSFVAQLHYLLHFIDVEANDMDKEDIIDKVKTHLLNLMQRFLAYPHGTNFALMPHDD